MPKIVAGTWTAHDIGPHPVSGQDDGPYATMALGDVVGLSQFGLHLERIPPGSRSSHRHWHENEDEFVYVVSGLLVLIEDEETLMQTGDAAAWKAGYPTAHCFENRGQGDAVMLIIGTRTETDVVHYPDHDMVCHRNGRAKTFTRADGTVIDQKG